VFRDLRVGPQCYGFECGAWSPTRKSLYGILFPTGYGICTV
jgi:hypothetical protein